MNVEARGRTEIFREIRAVFVALGDFRLPPSGGLGPDAFALGFDVDTGVLVEELPTYLAVAVGCLSADPNGAAVRAVVGKIGPLGRLGCGQGDGQQQDRGGAGELAE